MRVVVDSNIFFSALLKEENRFRSILLLSDDIHFFAPHFAIAELFRYKEKIARSSSIDADRIPEIFLDLLHKIEIFNEELISGEYWNRAYRLCHDIDENDTPFVALALALDADLFTGDIKLKNGLAAKGFVRFFNP